MPSASTLRVLIVDDQMSMRGIARYCLQEIGIKNVVEAKSGTEALAAMSSNKFDLIISNPPFFENNLKSPDAKRNLALHSDQLALHELISIAGSLLGTGGTLALLLPFHRGQACMETARQHGLFPNRVAMVRQTEQHDFFRIMLCFSSVETDPASEVITIQQSGAYSAEFVSLLKPYYLYL